eukprot:TRINITY_DN12798_c0_g3_i2.p1 TRINITY_DN12798_c0_g3~~TRINITY_DN12798_c0_g3_i2.p1  ORF type:complete len:567 (+),score=92.85 TRINITY_DN12798_c0_g3_i2:490-2190(+)
MKGDSLDVLSLDYDLISERLKEAGIKTDTIRKVVEKYFLDSRPSPMSGLALIRQKMLERINFYQRTVDAALDGKRTAAALDAGRLVGTSELRESQRRLRKLNGVNRSKVLNLLKKRRHSATPQPKIANKLKRALEDDAAGPDRVHGEQLRQIEEHLKAVIFRFLDPRQTQFGVLNDPVAIWSTMLNAMKERPTLDLIHTFVCNPASRSKRHGEISLLPEHRHRFLVLWSAIESIVGDRLAMHATQIDPASMLEDIILHYRKQIFGDSELKDNDVFEIERPLPEEPTTCKAAEPMREEETETAEKMPQAVVEPEVEPEAEVEVEKRSVETANVSTLEPTTVASEVQKTTPRCAPEPKARKKREPRRSTDVYVAPTYTPAPMEQTNSFTFQGGTCYPGMLPPSPQLFSGDCFTPTFKPNFAVPAGPIELMKWGQASQFNLMPNYCTEQMMPPQCYYQEYCQGFTAPRVLPSSFEGMMRWGGPYSDQSQKYFVPNGYMGTYAAPGVMQSPAFVTPMYNLDTRSRYIKSGASQMFTPTPGAPTSYLPPSMPSYPAPLSTQLPFSALFQQQ